MTKESFVIGVYHENSSGLAAHFSKFHTSSFGFEFTTVFPWNDMV